MIDLLLRVLVFCIPVYVFAFLLLVVRIVKGPKVYDSLLALDNMSFQAGVIIALISLLLNSWKLSLVPLVLSIVVFCVDVYVARYLSDKGDE
ncbi:monovalent cation/H+ antiporter complex subunit F [Pseudothermotoga thermarum]|uniref:Multiple resistance and pH regulation protein F n=1 Tax=Pseudothermotoga thermarum DSM 5069 TaxID=688269 RepID=F7YTZ6_9THEM|nr:monovalent cation/H+ antiporter complex subunit F [Pseudothermotoga thermarum]AEH51578.1 multiple resistance and pH regulation protein F [Pseudothermotoga thermarum DSM 5069]